MVHEKQCKNTNSTQNVTNKNIRIAKFLNLKNENETKNKNLSI
jgi:hypothetical protein